MSKLHPRALRVILIIVFALALSAVSVASAQSDTIITSPSDTYSFHVPSGWSDQSVDIINFAETIAFASNDTTLTETINFFIDGTAPNAFNGVGGIIGVIDPNTIGGQALAPLVDPLLQSLGSLLLSAGAQVTRGPELHTFGGQYSGELVELTVGSIGVMHNNDQLLVIIILSDDVVTNANAINTIIESIRIPAEAGGEVIIPVATATPEIVPSEEVTPATPEIVPSEEVTTLETETIRSSDLSVSLKLPLQSVVLDHIADAHVMAFGESSSAAESRLFSARPDLATETPITGNGGLIILYSMSQFGIDPANPDLSALMERALGNLAGYTVEQAAQPLEAIPNALYAVISGAEHGYLALIPFGDQIAYVTATSSTVDEFEQGETVLLDIVASVRMPAEPEPTPTPTASGLGGLGELVETEATAEPTAEPTVEPTPEATAAGLGGL